MSKRFIVPQGRRIAAALAVLALFFGGASYAVASTSSAPRLVACTYTSPTLTCPIPQTTVTAKATSTVTKTVPTTVVKAVPTTVATTTTAPGPTVISTITAPAVTSTVSGPTVTQTVTTSAAPSSNVLFEDDFNGPAGPYDHSKWGEWSTATYNSSAAYGSIQPGDRATLDGQGHLSIPATPTQGTSISTAGKFAFTYGTVTIRAMVPTTPGYWPALWTLNNTPSGTPDRPITGEMDIHESYTGLANYYHRAVHNYSDSTSWSASADPSAGLGHVFGEWHDYSAKIEPGQITFYFDGVQQGPPALKQEGAGKPYAFGPDNTNGNWILLTLAVGGAGGQQDGKAVAPAVFLIDRVEVRGL